MKFRDPETGYVFHGIQRARNMYCQGRDCDINCELDNRTEDCIVYCDCHPAEAARLMGYEVIEDEKEVNMEKKDKPLREWTLGEVIAQCAGQDDCRHPTECPFRAKGDTRLFCLLKRNPEYWELGSAPRLTEAELAIMLATGARWVSRDGNSANRVDLWTARPGQKVDRIYAGTEDEFLARVTCTLFPSVKPGDCIEVEVTAP